MIRNTVQSETKKKNVRTETDDGTPTKQNEQNDPHNIETGRLMEGDRAERGTVTPQQQEQRTPRILKLEG